MDFKKTENLVDVSSFFLFEATGDSESAGCSDLGLRVVSCSEEDDDDDAESCCSDVSDYCMASKMYGSYGGGEVFGRGFGDGEDHEEEEDYENGEVVEQGQERGRKRKRLQEDERWRGDKIPQRKQASNVSVDSEKIMIEREKSRVFWETCLAS